MPDIDVPAGFHLRSFTGGGFNSKGGGCPPFYLADMCIKAACKLPHPLVHTNLTIEKHSTATAFATDFIGRIFAVIRVCTIVHTNMLS